MVVYTHAFYLGGFGQEWLLTWSRGTITAGHIAVQCFFALSGWLVATSWCRQPVLGRFLWHRFLRIAPAMWLCLAVTAFVFTPLLWLTTPDTWTPFFQLKPSAWGYVWHNLVLPRSQIAVGPFPAGGAWNGDWNGSLWTLFYEGACYLMVAGLGLAGLLVRWRRLGTALIATLLVFHIVVASLPTGTLPALSLRLYDTPGKLLTLHFVAGAVGAMWEKEIPPVMRAPWFGGIALVILALCWRFPLHAWLSPFLLTPAVLALSQSSLCPDFEKRIGGDYSYGLYLYAYPAQQILASYHVQHLGFTVYLAGSLLLGLACAIASWHLIEKPALALKSLNRPYLPRTRALA
jgi:peptidoglycan/LPS O-acetylase OafA/YrhL